MASPTGCFVGLPQSTLDAFRTSAIARLTGGDITSVSEPGTSYGKAYRMAPADMLREVVYAEQAASGRRVIRTTRPDFSRCGGRGGAGNLDYFERGGGF